MWDELDAMQVIFSHGAERNATAGIYRHTPLHEAPKRNIDTVKLQLEYGAHTIQFSNGMNTPLHLAASSGRTDVAKFLVELWPGVNRKNEFEHTPLHLAVWFGRLMW
jgi:ankyrin repeat protein